MYYFLMVRKWVGTRGIGFFFLTLMYSWIDPAVGGASLAEDRFSTFTGVSLRALIQSVEVSQHFGKPKDEAEAFFQNSLKNDEENEGWPTREEVLPWVWRVGATYGRSTSPLDILDEVIGGRVGMEGEPLRGVTAGVLLALDSMPSENYRHGSAAFNFEYTFFLQPRSRRQKMDDDQEARYDKNDAWAYYRHLRNKNERRKTPKSVGRLEMAADSDTDEEGERETKSVYPNLKLAYHLGFHLHNFFPKTFRNLSRPQLTSDPSLVQFQNRLDISYAPDERQVFSAGLSYYGYSGIIENFTAQLESDVASRVPVIFWKYPTSITNQLVTFPWLSFDQSFEYSLSPKDSIVLNFNETIYQAEFQPNTYSMGPSYFVDLSKKWMMGIETRVTFGNLDPTFSGMVELNWRLE